MRPPDRTVEVSDVRRVTDLLARLEVLPGAVLVIRDGELLTGDDELRDGDRVEVRRHNAAFCRDCFFHYVRQQVSRAIAKHRMLAPSDRVLVAVSGGKDSLALWDLLLDLGYDADGLYLGLGIGEYSDESGEYARAFADRRGAKLVEIDIPTVYGF